MKQISYFLSISWVMMVAILTFQEGVSAEMTEGKVLPPITIGAWSRSASPRIITQESIFDYMNGGGELYLAYRFDQLEVYDYLADQKDTITVEIYFLQTSADAFGLLSLDWSGESIESFGSTNGPSLAPNTRALYGAGLLRLAVGSIYARILTYQETKESREAVLALGQVLADKYPPPSEPTLVKNLPARIGSEWKIRQDRIGFFRSHLVLNSLYYLSHKNILGLDHSVEAVSAPYESTRVTDVVRRVQYLLVKYPTPEKAAAGLDSFHIGYLNDHVKLTENDNAVGIYKIEDGWVGYRRQQQCLAIVFQSPTREIAALFLEAISCNY